MAGSPRVGKRRGRLAALKDEMSEKAELRSSGETLVGNDSEKGVESGSNLVFTDDPDLPEVSEAAKKELQVSIS